MDIRFVSTTSIASKKQGFTLIELLVVIALIGIIAAIGLVNLLESREKSENTTVVTQAYEYQKALQLHFADAGSYPSTPNGRVGIMCLGDTAPDNCLDGHSNGVSVASDKNSLVSGNIQAAIDPYMPSQPHILQPKGGHDFSSPAYSGCSDFINPSHYNNSVTKKCDPSDYSIWFVLKGTNEDCGRATLADPDFESVYTLCRLQEEQ